VEEEKPENKNFEIDKPLEQIAKEVQGMKIPQLGKWAVDNAPNSAAKEIATKVLARLKEFDKLKVFPKSIRVLNDSQFNTKGVRGAVTLASMRGVGIELTLRLNGLQNGVKSLPIYDNGNGKNYQGITATENYTPLLELIRFFTPFGIKQYNTITLKDKIWAIEVKSHDVDTQDLKGLQLFSKYYPNVYKSAIVAPQEKTRIQDGIFICDIVTLLQEMGL
jgi:hypothetical protein